MKAEGAPTELDAFPQLNQPAADSFMIGASLFGLGVSLA